MNVSYKKIITFALSAMLPVIVLLAHTTTATSVTSKDMYYAFVSPDSYYKTQGSTITFTGVHFYPFEKVFVQQNGVVQASVYADQNGDIATGLFQIPYKAGVISFTFKGATSNQSFSMSVTVGTVNPWITLSTYYAGSQAPITLMGHGYASNELVHVVFDTVDLGYIATDNNGNFSLYTTVPLSNTGQRIVKGIGIRSNQQAQQSFSQAY